MESLENLLEDFFAHIPDNSYIQILKPEKGQWWRVTIRTLDWKRVRATANGDSLIECLNELKTADMNLSELPLDCGVPQGKKVRIKRKTMKEIRDKVAERMYNQ